jgi:hypothetical protein
VVDGPSPTLTTTNQDRGEATIEGEVAVVWTSLGPLPQWVPGLTTRWAPMTTRLVPHDT